MQHKKILIVLVILGLSLRLYGIDWDQGQHLHPDERFLTMVTADASLPKTLSEYFDPTLSLLSPYNINYPFYVYGAFPIAVVKALSVVLGFDSYAYIPYVGRVMSALFDGSVILLVYAIARLATREKRYSNKVSLLGVLFYAIAVYPIQQAHFYTTDSFLQFFSYASLFFALLYRKNNMPRFLIASAVLFACALGSKLSALYILPLILAVAFVYPAKIRSDVWKSIRVVKFLTFACIAYIGLRFVNPSMFAGVSFLDPTLHPQFVNSLNQLVALSTSEGYFPPGIQWMSKNPLFPLQNVVVFGLGIPLGALMVKGVLGEIVFLMKRLYTSMQKRNIITTITKYYLPIIVIGWVVAVFVYQSFQFVKSIRYAYVLFPFLAMYSAYGLATIKNVKLRALVLVLTLVWPLCFMMIYTRPHSRVEASYWIHKHIPAGSVIATEHWDDALPLNLRGIENRTYEVVQLPVFAPDDEKKWSEMDELLHRADYYILTSNRGWGSIMEVPEKYPRMSRFYRDLFAGNTQFRFVKEFTSYPGFRSGFTGNWFYFPDQWSDEAFTVYDHPKVIIFKKDDIEKQ